MEAMQMVLIDDSRVLMPRPGTLSGEELCEGEQETNVFENLIVDKSFHIHTGDCLPFLRSIPDNFVDATITDPPYNMGYGYDKYKDKMPDDEYFSWQLEVLAECTRVTKEGGSVLWLHWPEWAGRMFWAAAEIIPDLKRYENIFWIYNTHNSGSPLKKGTRQWNWWSVGIDKPSYIGDKARRGTYKGVTDKRIIRLIEQGRKPVDNDWWDIPQVKNHVAEKTPHPCQLPLKMVRRLVDLVVPVNAIVLDPFAGSATVGHAALEQERRFIGSELSPDYAQIGIKRLESLLAEPTQGILL